MAWSPQARQAAALARKRKAKGPSRSVRRANKKFASKTPRNVGLLQHVSVDPRTGKVKSKSFNVHDSKYNQRKRRQYKAVGAAVGTVALTPGLGTAVGYGVGAHMGRGKYGQTLTPVKKKSTMHKQAKKIHGGMVSNPSVGKKKKR
jgi:hypothetical protein